MAVALPLQYLTNHRKPLVAVQVFLLLFLVAWADYVTRYELTLWILYLLPIFLATWNMGRNTGILVSLIAVIMWVVTDWILGHIHTNSSYLYWEGLLRFVSFVIFVFIVIKLKITFRNANTALYQSEGRYSSLIATLPHGVLECNLSGTVTLGNTVLHQILGYDDGEIMGKQIWDILPSDEQRGLSERMLPEIIQQRPSPTSYEAKVQKREGVVDIQVDWVYRENAEGKLSGFISVVTDITEKKQAEALNHEQQEKLQLTARLITAGEMASTLAHELNQPLAAIVNYNMGSVRRLRSGKWNPVELLAAMEKGSIQAERAGRIIRRVREFIQTRKPNRTQNNLNEMVAEVLSFVEIETERDRVSFTLELDPRLPDVQADKTMIEQLLLNLVKNAIESLQHMPGNRRKIKITTSVADDDMVQISIQDGGKGLPEQLNKNLFIPFFTTKKDGMGLGLNICRSIVEYHNGRIWAYLNPEGGSTFCFILPRESK